MCFPIAALGLSAFQTASLGLSALGTVMSAKGAYDQASIAQQTAANNAQIAEYQAQDAASRGAKEEQAIRFKASQVKGTQRAQMAASGLSLEEGSPLDVLVGTDYMLESDANTIRENTAKSQWALRNQAANYQAQSDAQSPFMAAGGELLMGAGRVADSWYRYTNSTGVGGLPFGKSAPAPIEERR